MFFSNNVKIAVDKAGGATRVANELKCSGTAVFSWIRKGRVSNLDRAKQLAELSGVALEDLRPC